MNRFSIIYILYCFLHFNWDDIRGLKLSTNIDHLFSIYIYQKSLKYSTSSSVHKYRFPSNFPAQFVQACFKNLNKNPKQILKQYLPPRESERNESSGTDRAKRVSYTFITLSIWNVLLVPRPFYSIHISLLFPTGMKVRRKSCPLNPSLDPLNKYDRNRSCCGLLVSSIKIKFDVSLKAACSNMTFSLFFQCVVHKSDGLKSYQNLKIGSKI